MYISAAIKVHALEVFVSVNQTFPAAFVKSKMLLIATNSSVSTGDLVFQEPILTPKPPAIVMEQDTKEPNARP